jgi:predicted dinucleotide-binding enzyme
MARDFELESLPCVTWHRGESRSPEIALRSADIVLLAIRDDAITSFIEDHPEFDDRPLLHFSGSLVLDRAPHRRIGRAGDGAPRSDAAVGAQAR